MVSGLCRRLRTSVQTTSENDKRSSELTIGGLLSEHCGMGVFGCHVFGGRAIALDAPSSGLISGGSNAAPRADYRSDANNGGGVFASGPLLRTGSLRVPLRAFGAGSVSNAEGTASDDIIAKRPTGCCARPPPLIVGLSTRLAAYYGGRYEP